MSATRGSLVLTAGFGLVLLCRGYGAMERSAVRPMAIADPSGPEFRGSGSCAATACHGSISRTDPALSPRVRRNEHTTWIGDDAHALAYQTLFDARSKAIVKQLTPDGRTHQPAHEDERCLACHTTPRPTATLKVTSWMDPDGVGCEACHGASGGWLGPHTTDWWADLSAHDKAGRGMTNTKDLVSRARTCAGCHVGEYSPDGLVRDVNHDLIAAGHPRLVFELAAFLDNMPPHWAEKGVNAGPLRPNQRAADLPARAWATGRLVTLRASLELLERRAASAQPMRDGTQRRPLGEEALPEPLEPSHATRPTAPWPEFSEHGCFSCHHDLRDEPWRRGPRENGAGSPRWGSWILPHTGDLLAHLVPEDVARSSSRSLGPLSTTMARFTADPATVRNEAHEVMASLDRSLESLAARRLDADDVRRLITDLDRPETWDRASSWDEATQLYLALVALRQSWVALDPRGKTDQDRLEAHLKSVRSKLMFPTGFDSPRFFDPARLRLGR
jgi:Cytochrome c554 and c-prime